MAPGTSAQASSRFPRAGIVRWLLVLCAIAVLGLLARFSPATHILTALVSWVHAKGVFGAIIFGLVYVLATVLFVPGSVLTMSSGFVYGVVWGSVLVSLASTMGATLSFLLGRFLLRDRLAPRVEKSPRLRAIFHAINGNGFKVIFLTRLSPIFPFGVVNYSFGLTDVSLGEYVLASWLGMLPATLMYVYVGSAAESVAHIASGHLHVGLGQEALFGVGLIATVLVAVFITRKARDELEGVLPSGHAQPADGE